MPHHVVAKCWVRGDTTDCNMSGHRKRRAIVACGRVGVECPTYHPSDMMSRRYAGASIRLNSHRRGGDCGGITRVTHNLSRRKGQHSTNSHPMRRSDRIRRFHCVVNHRRVRGTVGMRRRSTCRRAPCRACSPIRTETTDV